MVEYIKEPKKDCVFCMEGRNKCKALNELYCAMELAPCHFYKSKDEYDPAGKALKE